jgi:uncharacterized membrane protein YfcA
VSSSLTLRGMMAGMIAGFASGLLGVSPGGILVPVISMLLPYSQHVAQGISLVAQAPPTSFAALSPYSRRGQQIQFSSVLFVSAGFVAGGPVGAILAKVCSERGLRWMFVGYLLILTTLAIGKNRSARTNESETQTVDLPSFAPFFLIGIVAGLSSGLLGIGGGLAIIALSVGLLHHKQHSAQVMSLAVSAFPLTLPAAWVYVRQGFSLPWLVVGGLIAGLAVGSWLGGVYASRLTEERLRQGFVVLLIAMTAYMAFVAARS